MRELSTWGGHLEIQAASEVYGVNIVIHQVPCADKALPPSATGHVSEIV
jgi:hypothetical protein